jgi:hypothetical protein
MNRQEFLQKSWPFLILCLATFLTGTTTSSQNAETTKENVHRLIANTEELHDSPESNRCEFERPGTAPRTLAGTGFVPWCTAEKPNRKNWQ